MHALKLTAAFSEWLQSLDNKTKGRLTNRLVKAKLGNLGDVESVGDGVFEMREHFGPGYRMYYTKVGNLVILMIGGGDKSTQKKDILKAKQIASSTR